MYFKKFSLHKGIKHCFWFFELCSEWCFTLKLHWCGETLHLWRKPKVHYTLSAIRWHLINSGAIHTGSSSQTTSQWRVYFTVISLHISGNKWLNASVWARVYARQNDATLVSLWCTERGEITPPSPPPPPEEKHSFLSRCLQCNELGQTVSAIVDHVRL